VTEAPAGVAPATRAPIKLLGIFLIGAAVSVALGVYGGVHDPAVGQQPYKLFFSSTLSFKIWFATFAVGFACIQLFTALRMYGKIHTPKEMPPWWGDLHRLSGTLAFGCSVPVAYHCLWGIGFTATGVGSQVSSSRVLLHSLFGCFFYGIFAIKVLSVRVRGLPGWALPVVGSLTFVALVGVWTLSSVWWWVKVDFPAL
jgi:hypothetical protein